MVQGTKFVKGQYTYSYKQEGDYAGINAINWKNIDEDGWGVQLSSKVSTDPVSGEICSYINGKPIVSMNDAYYLSQATSIDITRIDTRNVTNMGNMFAGVNLTEPLNLSNFDTSNVTDMSSMFYLSAMKKMDISNFNTKNVTSMNGMFQSKNIDKFDLRNFDISNVTASNRMLGDTKINILNLSNLIFSDDTVLVDIFANSTIKEIIVNNEETLNILKSTSNIPSNMKFTLKTN